MQNEYFKPVKHEHGTFPRGGAKKQASNTAPNERSYFERPFTLWVISAWHRRNLWYHPDYDYKKAKAIHSRFKPIISEFLSLPFGKRFDIVETLSGQLSKREAGRPSGETIWDKYRTIKAVNDRLKREFFK